MYFIQVYQQFKTLPFILNNYINENLIFYDKTKADFVLDSDNGEWEIKKRQNNNNFWKESKWCWCGGNNLLINSLVFVIRIRTFDKAILISVESVFVYAL